MNRCPITYEDCGAARYSEKGLKLLSRSLRGDLMIPMTAQEQIQTASRLADKLSLAGVQPKISAKLRVKQRVFVPVERAGTFIIKPPHPSFSEIPENEDLTMHLAASLGIEVPLHGLVYASDGSLSYFIRRFDRYGHGRKWGVEDFSQLSGQKRDSKYDSSMERLIPIIETHCSFPLLDKLRLFRLTLFCFLVGNEHMHLKNFSLIQREGKVELSPAYDLLNSTLLVGEKEEFALPLNGKKRKLSKSDLIDYFAKERLKLNEASIDLELARFQAAKSKWDELLERSFLTREMKTAYQTLLDSRWSRLFF